MAAPAMIARIRNIQCQPSVVATILPSVGASSGETPRMRISIEMILELSSTGKKSRTMARASTCATQPPSACSNRKAISASTVFDSRQPMEANMNSSSPAYSGRLRPKRSSIGP
jgi:hypothetical protein